MSLPFVEAIAGVILPELSVPPTVVFLDCDSVVDGPRPFHVFCDSNIDGF